MMSKCSKSGEIWSNTNKLCSKFIADTLPNPYSQPTLHPICLPHPFLKGGYTGHEKTYFGDDDISPRLAETKRNQQFLEKSVLPIFLGRSRFWLFHPFFLLNPGNPPPDLPIVHAAASQRGGSGAGLPGFSRKNG